MILIHLRCLLKLEPDPCACVCVCVCVCVFAARKKKGLTANFSWIFNREVVLH